MLTLGAFAFAAPWVLAAAAGLPILWWLLRVTPPAPKLVRFPAIRLLLRLQEKEDTPARTPWWLLLLRILVVLLLIVGLAHPLINPQKGFERDGPLVIAIDNGWSAAPNWQARRNRVAELLDRAAREDRKVILVATAHLRPGEKMRASNLMRPADARAVFQAMSPQPWPADYTAATQALEDLAERVRNGNVVWFTDGLMHPDTEAFAAALTKIGRVEALSDGTSDLPVLLHPARLVGTRIVLAVERTAAGRPAGYDLALIDDNGRGIGRRSVTFEAHETKVDVALSLPSELRNRLARVSVEHHRSAGATLLLDERLRRRPVGLIAPVRLNDSQALMSDLFYIERALSPFSEIRKGPVAQLLQRPLSVVFLHDRATLTRQARALLADWIEAGGLLVRFAGPALAQNPDRLVPVRLRGGNRSFGGAMTWAQPLGLSPFDTESPFAGLTVPGDATVKRQVLAEPGVDLDRKTWARLRDGTPLVTAEPRGKGLLVLFHIMANPGWSTLPLSGLFVEMLRRTVALSRGVAEAGARTAALAPFRVLDGFGRLGEAQEWVRPIGTAQLQQAVVGPANPPGLYGAPANRRSLNLSATVKGLEPLATLPANITRLAYEKAQEIDLRPWLLVAAFALFLLDLAIGFLMRGLVPRRAAAATAALLLLAVPAGALLTPQPALAQAADGHGDGDEEAIRATRETVFAYVRTGDREADLVSRRGLIGLGNILSSRTSVEPGPPRAVDVNIDRLAFYPLLYWPVTTGQSAPGKKGKDAVHTFLVNGGMIVFDIRIRDGFQSGALGKLVGGLKIPALQRAPADHVLTRSYYLLQRFPGRRTGAPVWVAQRDQTAKDGVSPVIIGANDWAAAWAVDRAGRPMFPVHPGGEYQRELAYRVGVNIVMHALTGNYKADQVHIPTILRRLGQ